MWCPGTDCTSLSLLFPLPLTHISFPFTGSDLLREEEKMGKGMEFAWNQERQRFRGASGGCKRTRFLCCTLPSSSSLIRDITVSGLPCLPLSDVDSQTRTSSVCYALSCRFRRGGGGKRERNEKQENSGMNDTRVQARARRFEPRRGQVVFSSLRSVSKEFGRLSSRIQHE